MNPCLNDLLKSLPEKELQILTEKMELVSLTKGRTLFETGQIPAYLYFPVGSVISMIIDHPNGDSVETYMMGNACFAGVGALGVPSFYRATVRSSGLAYRIAQRHLSQAMLQCPSYAARVNDGVQRMLMRLSQSVLCGKKHTVEQQLVRWILITLDRTMSERIDITHSQLSDLLGFRREGVTVALGRFADAGLVQIIRGAITVLDRDGLEKRSCDCYWIGQEKKRPDLCLS